MKLSIHTYLKSGRYRILQVLGQGGFGITYKAVDTETGKEYAIKELYPNIFCTRRGDSNEVCCTTETNKEHFKKLKQRFLKEVKNLHELHHRGIIEVYDVFEENNTIYYAMELIKGKTLDELVRENGPLSVEKAKGYIKLICDALGYIHSKNMTHLDIKPANILIRQSDDMPILIDFGLSKQYDASGGATSTLLNAASQGFSPIEQYGASNDLMTFSPASDIYSLSATLLFMLTGKTPPPATQLAFSPLNLSAYTFPESIKKTIKKGMSLDKAHRFADVKSFLDSLENKTLPTNNNGASSSSAASSTKVMGTGTGNVGKTPPPEPPVKKSMFINIFAGIVIGIIVLFVLFKCGGISAPVENPSHDSDSIPNDTIGPIDTISPIDTIIPQKEDVSLSASRTLTISGPSYEAKYIMTVSNGKFHCDQTINGEHANYTLKCSTTVSAEKVLDQAEGYYNFCAAADVGVNIVNEYGTYSEVCMDATLKFLKQSMDALSQNRGASTVAYGDVKSRYDMLNEIKNNPTEQNLNDVEIIVWGMGEHPISPKNVAFE